MSFWGAWLGSWFFQKRYVSISIAAGFYGLIHRGLVPKVPVFDSNPMT